MVKSRLTACGTNDSTQSANLTLFLRHILLLQSPIAWQFMTVAVCIQASPRLLVKGSFHLFSTL